MILKYKGSNNEWVYMAGDKISWKSLKLKSLKDEYEGTDKTQYSSINPFSDYIYNKMMVEINSGSDYYIVKSKKHKLENIGVFNIVQVVNFERSINDVIGLYDEVYLLNDNGKTVERL